MNRQISRLKDRQIQKLLCSYLMNNCFQEKLRKLKRERNRRRKNKIEEKNKLRSSEEGKEYMVVLEKIDFGLFKKNLTQTFLVARKLLKIRCSKSQFYFCLKNFVRI